jgi:hypothetical protein
MRTHFDSSPTRNVCAPRAVLERDAPAKRHEPAHEQRLNAVREAPYHILRLLRTRRLQPVHVYLRHGRLEGQSRVPSHAHEYREYRRRRERLPLLRERRVQWVLLECGSVCTRLPYCRGGKRPLDTPTKNKKEWNHAFSQWSTRYTMAKKTLTQEPEILVWSLYGRTPVMRCQALVPGEAPSRSVSPFASATRGAKERDILPVMRDEVPNCLEERWIGYALCGRDESDNFDDERFGCHRLLLFNVTTTTKSGKEKVEGLLYLLPLGTERMTDLNPLLVALFRYHRLEITVTGLGLGLGAALHTRIY